MPRRLLRRARESVRVCARPQSLNRTNPAASPAKAKAVHGKIGKSHGCGAPKVVHSVDVGLDRPGEPGGAPVWSTAAE